MKPTEDYWYYAVTNLVPGIYQDILEILELVCFIKTGIPMVLSNGSQATPKVMTLSSHFELPAPAAALELVCFCEHDSCSFCLEHGQVVKTGPNGGHVMTFPFQNTATGHVKLRSAEDVQQESYDALGRNETVSQCILSFVMDDVVSELTLSNSFCVSWLKVGIYHNQTSFN